MTKESKLMQQIHKQRENRWRRAGRNLDVHFQLVKKDAQKILQSYGQNYQVVVKS